MSLNMQLSGICPATVLCAFLIFTVALHLPCSADEPRIVGGFPVDGSSTKHQVSIRSKSVDQRTFGQGHICGGSLINRNTVLTAAHCLVDTYDKPRPASYFRVVGGNNNRSTQTTTTVVLDVKKVIVHGSYVSFGFLNDVGLLTLTTNVPSGHPTLQPIVTATQVPLNGTVCQTSGWGSIDYNGPSSEQLLAVNVSLIAKITCNAATSYAGSIVNGMLCAGDMAGGKDACQGDSGGPLVCNGILVGIVSHGAECARPRYPGVYADVAYYRNWIVKSHSVSTFGRSSPLFKGVVGIITSVMVFALCQRFALQ